MLARLDRVTAIANKWLWLYSLHRPTVTKVFDTKQFSSHSLGAKTLTLAIPLLFSLSGGKDSPEYPSSICLGFQERARGSPLHVILCASSPAQSHIHHGQSLFDLLDSVLNTWDAAFGCTAMGSPLQAPIGCQLTCLCTHIYHGESM